MHFELKKLKIINPKRAEQDWLYINLVLHNIQTSLFEDYLKWSKQSTNYNEEECLKKFIKIKNNITNNNQNE